jgi:hypothetical protein
MHPIVESTKAEWPDGRFVEAEEALKNLLSELQERGFRGSEANEVSVLIAGLQSVCAQFHGDMEEADRQIEEDFKLLDG